MNGAYGHLVNRFGATSVALDSNIFLIIGGIVRSDILHQDYDILVCRLSLEGATCQIIGRLSDVATLAENHIPRPLLIGSSAIKTGNDQVVVIGGGATCFSMGTFWTRGVYTLAVNNIAGENSRKQAGQSLPRWKYWRDLELVTSAAVIGPQIDTRGAAHLEIAKIPRVGLKDTDEFEGIVTEARPVVLEGIALGPCVQRWTPEYLAQSVGLDKTVRDRPELSKASRMVTGSNFLTRSLFTSPRHGKWISTQRTSNT